MDVLAPYTSPSNPPITCIDMHTTGEPTRIIISGFPHLPGPSLLEQRAQAKAHHDNVRRRLMLEPRGHYDMYGAILCRETELVNAGKAHIGVLFTHNQGFSTMCGHATIALGRFLVDTHDKTVFPKRDELVYDPVEKVTKVNIHAPCGLVRVTVPTKETDKLDENGKKITVADSSRPVTFVSTPAFASGVNVTVTIPEDKRWPELIQQGKTTVTLDVSFGGTYYALINVKELGFTSGGLRKGAMDLDSISRAVKLLKSHLIVDPEFKPYITHPTTPDYSFLYSVMVVDNDVGVVPEGVDGAETGLCFFADHQIDRSPTGSCVVARMALAAAKGVRKPGERWTYHSVVSNAFEGEGGFTASIVEEADITDSEGKTVNKGVRVRVEGKAFYTGSCSFVYEEGDITSESGFSMQSVTQA
ncbi:proline racemase [Ascosphaera apis ARSEF 7405]|uniref:trans-L-3-hydroxyproline dehydratase n=1 Tax=Ascosphaera apis ARSEF 7405 TaxID=392613 RepID=A0A162II39_9EURO|nr:proline racemase [Ascosphaera apis ARSEF 7405]